MIMPPSAKKPLGITSIGAYPYHFSCSHMYKGFISINQVKSCIHAIALTN